MQFSQHVTFVPTAISILIILDFFTFLLQQGQVVPFESSIQPCIYYLLYQNFNFFKTSLVIFHGKLIVKIEVYKFRHLSMCFKAKFIYPGSIRNNRADKQLFLSVLTGLN